MPDGATYRDHLLVALRGGIDMGELDPPPVPAGLGHVVDAFWQLRRAAGSNGMAPNAIAFTEIECWQRLHGVEFDPMEVELISVMDSAALAAISEQKA